MEEIKLSMDGVFDKPLVFYCPCGMEIEAKISSKEVEDLAIENKNNLLKISVIQQENAKLRELATRFYNEDGSYTEYTVEEVIQMRKEAAKKLAHYDKLRNALIEAKIPHTIDDLPACPKAWPEEVGSCNCGAEDHNKTIDEALEESKRIGG